MSKYIVCKRTYLNQLIPHEPVINCKSPDCWGAHNINEFFINDEINEFRQTKLTNELILDLYLEMKKVISNNWELLYNLNVINIPKSVFNKLDFLQMLNMWKQLSCSCRKFHKKFSDYHFLKSRGISKNDIPTLNLNQFEPYAWGFEKSLHNCPQHQKFLNAFKNGANKIELFKDFCHHSHNCKMGTHHLEKQICYDDFNTGSCSCPSKKEYHTKQLKIKQELKNLKFQFKQIIKFKCPIIDNTNGALRRILLKIRDKIYENEMCFRKIHLSDDPKYIPFNIVLNKYFTKLEQEQNMIKKEEHKLTNKLVVKTLPKVRVGFRNSRK